MGPLRRKGVSAGRSDGLVCVVTGAAGCVGGHLVEMLCSESEYREIRVLDVKPFVVSDYDIPEEKASLVRVYQGSVTDRALVFQLIDGADVVFHVAALVDWGQNPRSLLFDVHVTGTDNVVSACKAHASVQSLIFTGTFYVCCWKGVDHVRVGDEDGKVPDSPKDFSYQSGYAESKAIAEKMVFAANGFNDRLRVVSLRLTSIYGERDSHSVPAFLKSARSKLFVIRVGSSSTVMAHVYARNAAHAHIMAARELRKGSGAKCQAKGYFISDDYPPTNYWDFHEPFVTQQGLTVPPPYPYIPGWLAMIMAYINVFIAWLVSPFMDYDTQLTPDAVTALVYSNGFVSTQSQQDFGYYPPYTCDEALQRTLAYYEERKTNDLKKPAS